MTLKTIRNVEELKKYLNVAIQLEHARIPPYFTALCSLHPLVNGEARGVLRAVIVEEVVHLTLAANLLNAVGGTPDLTQAGFVPSYPVHLPDGETGFEVGLASFSADVVENFLRFERSSRSSAGDLDLLPRARSPRALLPMFRPDDAEDQPFFSIGAFYREIRRGIALLHQEALSRGRRLFVGDPARQVTPELCSSGGAVVAVVDVASAREATRLMCERGEGPGWRTLRTSTGQALGVDSSAVYPIKPNGELSEYPEGSRLRTVAIEFGRAYHGVLVLFTQALSGKPQLLSAALADLFRLEELARELVETPFPGLEGLNGAPLYAIPKESQA